MFHLTCKCKGTEISVEKYAIESPVLFCFLSIQIEVHEVKRKK